MVPNADCSEHFAKYVYLYSVQSVPRFGAFCKETDVLCTESSSLSIINCLYVSAPCMF